MSDDKKQYYFTPWLSALLVILVTFLCFLPSLYNGWTNWDDPTYILQNKLVTTDNIQWSEIFSEGQVLGIYHPVTLISYAIDYQIWGLKASGYHLTNVIFHVVNSLLVFLVFRRLGTSLAVATTIALLFGIHPMHVESVTWISERKDVLYLFFLLLAWLSYLKYRSAEGKRSWLWYGLVLILFALSILSKPVAFVFPVVLVLSDYLLDQKFSWKSILNKIPIGILAIAAIFIAQWGQADSDSIAMNANHPVPTFFYGSYNVIFYAIKAFIPVNLSIFHPFPTNDSMNWMFYASIIPLLGILWGLYWSYRKSYKVFFGLSFFVLTITPLLQIIPFGKTLSSERYTYLPYLGLFYLIAIGMEHLIRNHSKLKAVTTIGALLFVSFLIFQTTQQQNVWKNSDTLWTSVIEQYPDAYYPYVCRGRYYNDQKQPEKAWKDFDKSISLHSNVEAHYERGLMLEAKGKYNEALEDYIAATNGALEYPKAHLNAAIIYGRLGNRSKAKRHIKKALKQDPNYSLARFNYAVLLKIERHRKEALKEIERACKLEPNNLRYREMRAAIHTDLGNNLKAIKDFKAVLNENPNNGTAQFYLGMNYHFNGKNEEARKHLKKASELNYALPDIIKTTYNLD